MPATQCDVAPHGGGLQHVRHATGQLHDLQQHSLGGKRECPPASCWGMVQAYPAAGHLHDLEGRHPAEVPLLVVCCRYCAQP